MAQLVIEKPSWLEGKRTFIGLGLTVAGMLGSRYNLKLPVAEVNNFLDLLAANWDGVAQVAGAAIAAYGALRKAMRERKTKAVVVHVTNSLVDTTYELQAMKEAVEDSKLSGKAKEEIINPEP